jgi:hypothetical protein
MEEADSPLAWEEWSSEGEACVVAPIEALYCCENENCSSLMLERLEGWKYPAAFGLGAGVNTNAWYWDCIQRGIVFG